MARQPLPVAHPKRLHLRSDRRSHEVTLSHLPRCVLGFQETKAKNLPTFVRRFSFDLSASLSLPSFSWPSPSWALSLRIAWLTSWLSYRPSSSARPCWRLSLRPAGLSSSPASALPQVLPAGCPSHRSLVR